MPALQLMGDEFITRPVKATDLVPGDVVSLKGGPARVYGWAELPLSGRIVLGFMDVNCFASKFLWSGWTAAACPNPPRMREVVVDPDALYPTFPPNRG
jgi:hypothetical protein